MPAQASSLRQYLLAAVIALGLSAVWCVVAAWLIVMVESAAVQSRVYEQPYFRSDGEVVIMRYPQGPRSTSQEFVDLSGQAIKTSTSQLLGAQYVAPSPPMQDWIGPHWNTRLAGINDGGTPAVYWYLIHDGRVGGSAYGVGYHATTRRIVGYFGRQGFTSALPPRADWFTVDGGTGLSLKTPLALNTEPYWNAERGLYLVANGKLWAIEPQQKRVRTLADAPPGATVGWIWDLRNPPPEAIAAAGPAGAAPSVASASAPRTLLVRGSDACILVDPDKGERATIPLPPELQRSTIAGAELADGNLLLFSRGGTSTKKKELVAWIDPEGKMVKKHEMRLQDFSATFGGEDSLPWTFLIAAPFPAGQGPTLFILPLQLMGAGQADSYAAAFLSNLQRAWPALLGAALIGAICAFAAYRRQQQFALPGAIGWAIFAFLFGLPGWIAYRFHRTWPVVEACPACDQPAPRDREACTECGASFPPPPLKGIEVFA